MIFSIDKSSKVPVYHQIADWLEAQIESGELKEGQRLPAERKLCTQTGAARNTIKRAYEELIKRGRVVTEQNSGSYVKSREMDRAVQEAEAAVKEAVQKLRDAGLLWHETEHIFLEYIWNHLPENEKIRVAWVDCSVEILRDTADEIGKFCNARVTPLLLDDVRKDIGLLLEGSYDVVATTVNHYDDMIQMVEKKTGSSPDFDTDMVVLGISRMSVSRLAKIEEDMCVAVVYEEEWYRYSIERYLQELSVKGKIRYVPLFKTMDYLKRNTDKKAVILPQDFSYGAGLIKEIYKYCAERGIFCFAFQQMIDNGSLMHLKKQIQERWMGMPTA